MSEPEPAPQPRSKPPKRYWHASEPFVDLKLSHWVEIVLTVALVFVGVSQLVVYTYQAGIMRKQLNEMQAQRNLTIAQLRAKLKREQPKLTAMTPDNRVAGQGESFSKWEISPWWTNVGLFDVSSGKCRCEQFGDGCPDQVDDAREGCRTAITPGSGPGGLEQAIERFEPRVGIA